MMYEDEQIDQIPKSAIAEDSVIGGLLIAPQYFNDLVDDLTPDDFYYSANAAYYKTIGELLAKNIDVDIITVAEAQDDVDASFRHLAELANNTPSISNIRGYAAVVKDKAYLRSLLRVSGEIYSTVYDKEKTTEDKILEAQKLVLSIESNAGEEVAQANASIKAVIQEIDDRFTNKGAPIGVPTGFIDIDNKIAGMRAGNLIILAARPAMGKTALAMNIAENVIRQGRGVLVFSLEMSKEELIERMVSSSSGIFADRIRRGTLEECDWPKLTAGVSTLKDAPLYIDDRGGLSINQIISCARKMHKKHKIKLIIIDYLQLISAKSNSREQEISKISRSLKGLAKELAVPVITLSQLNRKCEERTNKRPNLSDLRDSGAIEQDADIVAFIYRDEVYDENTELKGVAEILFAKGRGFPTGTVCLGSRLDINKFITLEHQPKIHAGKGKGGSFNYE